MIKMLALSAAVLCISSCGGAGNNAPVEDKPSTGLKAADDYIESRKDSFKKAEAAQAEAMERAAAGAEAARQAMEAGD